MRGGNGGNGGKEEGILEIMNSRDECVNCIFIPYKRLFELPQNELKDVYLKLIKNQKRDCLLN